MDLIGAFINKEQRQKVKEIPNLRGFSEALVRRHVSIEVRNPRGRKSCDAGGSDVVVVHHKLAYDALDHTLTHNYLVMKSVSETDNRPDTKHLHVIQMWRKNVVQVGRIRDTHWESIQK